MKIQPFLLSLSAILTVAYGLWRLSNYLYFGTVAHGQSVLETDFVYDFQTVAIDATGPFGEGKPFERTEVYLVNKTTGNRFEIPAGFNFQETSNGSVCRHCVAEIQANDKTYLITRANAGASGDYSSHLLLEIAKQTVVNQGQYLSCGRVYVRNNQITFPSHITDCPEILPRLSWNGWDYKSFSLSEN